MSVGLGANAIRVRAELVNSDYFRVMGVKPVVGTLFGNIGHASGSLLVLSWRVRPGCRNYLEPVVFPNGEPGVKLKDSYVIDSVYSSRIDVIDLHRGELVAQLNQPGLLIGLAGQDLVIERVMLPGGFTQLSIWKLALNRPKS
jgi:hypothetical protein